MWNFAQEKSSLQCFNVNVKHESMTARSDEEDTIIISEQTLILFC